jgi:hypothetical protein
MHGIVPEVTDPVWAGIGDNRESAIAYSKSVMQKFIFEDLVTVLLLICLPFQHRAQQGHCQTIS